jgi:hypothetical protein
LLPARSGREDWSWSGIRVAESRLYERLAAAPLIIAESPASAEPEQQPP